ncbi:hypothetical protein NBRC3257_3324 [Gluconobacter thailandicus NBRC 3257]|uniref:Uncharacterized protein n=1 Tax=Gluconobacter thailandicus NBRC 3257 TaxID=1381097 RepID=A0ABQ0J1J7_GLUTH|nr:hypothetical protein NBRC3257_3324 [Gluconobacter thailandicus NBRC 3257]
MATGRVTDYSEATGLWDSLHEAKRLLASRDYNTGSFSPCL